MGKILRPKNNLSFKVYLFLTGTVQDPIHLQGIVNINKRKALATIPDFILLKMTAAPIVPNKNGFRIFQNLFNSSYGFLAPHTYGCLNIYPNAMEWIYFDYSKLILSYKNINPNAKTTAVTHFTFKLKFLTNLHNNPIDYINNYKMLLYKKISFFCYP